MKRKQNPLKKFFKPLLAALLIVTCSCEKESSSDVDSGVPIYQDYLVTYDKVKNRTISRATFKTNNDRGTRLELADGSSISCNGVKAEYYSNVTNYFYRWEQQGFKDCQYEYKKAEVGTFKNKISFEERHEISFATATPRLSIGSSTEITWIGLPIQAHESIQYYVRQGTATGGFSSTSRSGLTALTVDNFHIGGMSPGPAILHVVRSKIINVLDENDDPAGGEKVVEVELEKHIILQ